MSKTELTDPEMLMDRALSRFDFTRVEHLVVQADPETTYGAVRRLDLAMHASTAHPELEMTPEAMEQMKGAIKTV